MTMMVDLFNPRDVREFVTSKRRKREPIRWQVDGAAEAVCCPSTMADFEGLRAGLRASQDFGRASERLDALEHALFARHLTRFSKPRKIVQNADLSLTLWWGDEIMIRCFVNGMVSLVGGAKGMVAKAITSELLDALAFAGKIHA